MSVIKKWYVGKPVKKVGKAEVIDVIETSRKEIKKSAALNAAIGNPDVDPIGATVESIISNSVELTDAKDNPLVIIPLASFSPFSAITGPIGSGAVNDPFGSFYGEYLKEIEANAETADPLIGDDGEIQHFIIKAPLKQILDEDFKRQYPEFSKKAFLTEVLQTPEFRAKMSDQVIFEFVEYEREKIEKVGKFLANETVQIESLNINIEGDELVPYNRVEGLPTLIPVPENPGGGKIDETQIETQDETEVEIQEQIASLEDRKKILEEEIQFNVKEQLRVQEEIEKNKAEADAIPEFAEDLVESSTAALEETISQIKEENNKKQYEIDTLTLELDALYVQLDAAQTANSPKVLVEGLAQMPDRYLGLLNEIKQRSDIFMTSRFRGTTGDKNNGALILLEAFMIIPPETAKKLQEIRGAACIPSEKKEKKKKPDDTAAELKNKENRGKNNFQDDGKINSYKLSAAQKGFIDQRVKARIEKVPDAAFVNMLINVDKITSVKDAFKFVYDVIPVAQILQIAAECLQAQIGPVDVVVCEIIMEKLNDDTLNKILKYANVNINKDQMAAQFQTLILDEFLNEVYNPGEEAFTESIGETANSIIPPSLMPQLKSFLIDQYSKNATTKNVICAMIFAAVPAAITMLALLLKKQNVGIWKDRLRLDEEGRCSDSLAPSEEKLMSILKNPAENFLNQTEAAVFSHPVLSFTKNFVDNIIDQVILLVEQLCIYAVTKLIKQIAQLCEDSEESDYNGAPTGSPIRDQNNIADLQTDPQIYGKLFDAINISNPGATEQFQITEEMLVKFFLAIGELLTISELCLIFDGDPNSQTFTFAFDKIWYGVLSTQEFLPLKSAFKTKDGLLEILEIFGDQFNDSLCSDKVSELTKAKKLLNEICEANPNEALIQDLSDKLASSAIEQMLEEDKNIIKDILAAMRDLIEPEAQELFCGPEAQRKNLQPIIDNFLEPGTVKLSRQTLLSLLNTAEVQFETELANFPSTLKAPAGAETAFPAINQLFGYGLSVAQNQKALYGFQEGVGNTEEYQSNIGQLTESFKSIVKQNSFVAQNTFATLNTMGNNIVTSVEGGAQGLSDDTVISIALKNIILNQDEQNEDGESNSDAAELIYTLNFTSEIQNALLGSQGEVIGPDGFPLEEPIAYQNSNFVQPKKSKLIFLRPTEIEGQKSFSASEADLPVTSLNDIRQMLFYQGGVGVGSAYEKKIGDYIGSSQFYANILEQIIKEHAEFMTRQDLFQKKNFDKLKFIKEFACDISLFNYKGIVGSYEQYFENAKKIACNDGFGKTPSPLEKLNIYHTYEAYVLLIAISEMLKSLFTFTAFGIEALMPGIESGNFEPQSLYTSYLISEIERKSFSIQPPALDDNSITVILDVYSALQEEDRALVTMDKVNIFILSGALRRVQNVLYKKLIKAGIPTKLTDPENLSGVYKDEFNKDTNQIQTIQKLKNIVAINPNGLIGPPKVKTVKLYNGYIRTMGSNYSSIPRLNNGGFFIEQGIEILHSTKEETQLGNNTLNQLLEEFFGFQQGIGFNGSKNAQNFTKLYKGKDDIDSVEKIINNLSNDIYNYSRDTSKYLFGSFNSSEVYDDTTTGLNSLFSDIYGLFDGFSVAEDPLFTADTFYDAYLALTLVTGETLETYTGGGYDFFDAYDQFIPTKLAPGTAPSLFYTSEDYGGWSPLRERFKKLLPFLGSGRLSFTIAFNIAKYGIGAGPDALVYNAGPAFTRTKNFTSDSILSLFFGGSAQAQQQYFEDKGKNSPPPTSLMGSDEAGTLFRTEGFLSYSDPEYVDGYLSYFNSFKSLKAESEDPSLTFLSLQDMLNIYLMPLYPTYLPEKVDGYKQQIYPPRDNFTGKVREGNTKLKPGSDAIVRPWKNWAAFHSPWASPDGTIEIASTDNLISLFDEMFPSVISVEDDFGLAKTLLLKANPSTDVLANFLKYYKDLALLKRPGVSPPKGTPGGIGVDQSNQPKVEVLSDAEKSNNYKDPFYISKNVYEQMLVGQNFTNNLVNGLVPNNSSGISSNLTQGVGYVSGPNAAFVKAALIRYYYREHIINKSLSLNVSIANKPRIGLKGIAERLQGEQYDKLISWDFYRTEVAAAQKTKQSAFDTGGAGKPNSTLNYYNAVLAPMMYGIKERILRPLLVPQGINAPGATQTENYKLYIDILKDFKSVIFPITEQFSNSLISKVGIPLIEKNFDVAWNVFNAYRKTRPEPNGSYVQGAGARYALGTDHEWFDKEGINEGFAKTYGGWFYYDPDPYYDATKAATYKKEILSYGEYVKKDRYLLTLRERSLMRFVPPGNETYKLKLAIAMLADTVVDIGQESKNVAQEGLENAINLISGEASTIYGKVRPPRLFDEAAEGYGAYLAEGTSPFDFSFGALNYQAIAKKETFFIDLVDTYMLYKQIYGNASTNIESLETLIKTSNYFKKINHYKTLNILIPFEEVEEVFGYNPLEFNDAYFTGETDSNLGLNSRKAFLNKAAMERKFLIEESNNRKFFKLPLARIDNEMELPETINNIANVLKQEIADEGDLLEMFAKDPKVKKVIDSIDYKNMLSFVAILIKETIEIAHPRINNTFNRTDAVLRGAGQNLQNVANRGNLADQGAIFQNDLPSAQITAPSQADVDSGIEFLKGMLKAVANMTDPTWQTPWLLPGPLTPFGVITKLLEADSSEQDTTAAAEANKPSQDGLTNSLTDKDCDNVEADPTQSESSQQTQPAALFVPLTISAETLGATIVPNLLPGLINNEET